MPSPESNVHVLRDRAALQFLPASLEILETPASPVGRAIGGILLLFCVVALAWATFGREGRRTGG